MNPAVANNTALALNILIQAITQISTVASKFQQAAAQGRDITDAEVDDARTAAVNANNLLAGLGVKAPPTVAPPPTTAAVFPSTTPKA